MGLARAGIDWIDKPAAGFELARRERAELGDRVAGKELRRDPVLHVRGHGLQRLLADFGKVPGLVDHPAHLAAHAERAGLARVPAAHRAPQRHPPDPLRRLERVADRLPAARGCHVRAVIAPFHAKGAPSRRSARSGRARTTSRLPASLAVSLWSSPARTRPTSIEPVNVSSSREWKASSLKAASHGCDALRIEAEPVHPSHIAGVLDLDASIHDDGKAARLRNARAFLVDHRN